MRESGKGRFFIQLGGRSPSFGEVLTVMMFSIVFSYCLAGKEALVCEKEKEEVVQVKAQQVLMKMKRNCFF